ncbi:squalene/phytoene synthase family protein [Aliiroseovarius sp.]|uniref:squalene/phytoene synthase family protein n=1 Tax=Aliiroseovarius sp. TaxID=1872442 RepID=UPI0026392CE1|nr:squalene/phytoene synthase family protein [Aliiroseovarius sp.]
MSHQGGVQACAELVERGDPDRFLSAMTGPVAAREVLFPLYAFNLELARAPYVTQDPIIARMRLQFWTDTLDEIAAGKPPRAHEVAEPLAHVLRTAGADLVRLHGMVEARVADIGEAGPMDADSVTAYARGTAGNLMAVAGGALGGEDRAGFERIGTAQGIANWLLAQPALRAAGRGFVAPAPEVYADLAHAGLRMLAPVKAGSAVPALRAAWRTKGVLARTARDPEGVMGGSIAGSEFARRGGLLWKSVTGRW